jgi:hypothetical protein
MGLLAAVHPRRHDPFWDLEGRGVRRRRRLRRLQALLAWVDLGAIALLALAGPATFRIADLF